MLLRATVRLKWAGNALFFSTVYYQYPWVWLSDWLSGLAVKMGQKSAEVGQ